MILPVDPEGQLTAARSPAAVFFQMTSPLFSSGQISWGSGHLFSLQRLISPLSPGQESPPKKGPSHDLRLCWFPPPHVRVQLPQVLQDSQRPSTAGRGRVWLSTRRHTTPLRYLDWCFPWDVMEVVGGQGGVSTWAVFQEAVGRLLKVSAALGAAV